MTKHSPSHRRIALWILLAVLITTGIQFTVLADESEKTEGPFYSRPEAIDPPSKPYIGPPMGGSFAPSEAIFPRQELPIRFFHDTHAGMSIKCSTCHSKALTSEKSSDGLLPEMSVCLQCHNVLEAKDNMPSGGGPPPGDCSTCHTSYAENPAIFEDDIAEEIDDIDEDNPNEIMDVVRQVENPPTLPLIPAPNIKFPHKTHIEANIACAACHTDMESVELATRMNLPTMSRCLDCHTSASNTPSDSCATCHLTQIDGRLQTKFTAGVIPGTNATPILDLGRISPNNFMPPTPVLNTPQGRELTLIPTGRFRGDDHRFDFIQTHRVSAVGDESYCASCHTETFCIDCHNGAAKPAALHPPNYAQLHSIDAFNDDPQCSSCHTKQDFCTSCHTQVGLTPKVTAQFGVRYHPANWVLPPKGSSGFTGFSSEHSVAAQRNIGACASCHTEELCIGCHSTQSTFAAQPINPHPDGWSSGRCASALQRNNTACLKCHLISDPLLNLCR